MSYVDFLVMEEELGLNDGMFNVPNGAAGADASLALVEEGEGVNGGVAKIPDAVVVTKSGKKVGFLWAGRGCRRRGRGEGDGEGFWWKERMLIQLVYCSMKLLIIIFFKHHDVQDEGPIELVQDPNLDYMHPYLDVSLDPINSSVLMEEAKAKVVRLVKEAKH
ncbi:hypothetical protein VNO78_07394 [Psophocarpus tetragonolobus]|uniref:Uncharacterized protein n=1 Tax=Psophocarpus tetragonolobus TaxID=3891 RepID=A0AAN9SW41_PSOTE